MQALNDYVIMKECEDTDEVTTSGIVVSTTFNPKELVKGEVVSVGTDSKYVNGDSVVYVLRPMCKEMPINGVTYLVTKSENILAIA